MKYIRTLTLRNWLCFRGDHVLKLEPKAYALVARHVRDQDRSNWLGKSATFEAVDFAIRGALNPDRHMHADGWITDGEPDGFVRCEFDDGSTIERSRKVGKSTQLHVGFGGNVAKGDEAQSLIVQAMGISHEDFPVMCYFRQRQMARFILSKPEDRMDFVRTWLNLAPLEAAEERSRSDASVVVGHVVRLTAELERLRLIANGVTVDGISRDIPTIEADIAKTKDKLARLNGVLADNASLALSTRLVSEYETLFDQQRHLNDEQEDVDKLRRMSEQADQIVAKLRESLQVARQDVETKSALSTGAFDGRCPVAEMVCPAKDAINRDLDRNTELLSAAQVVLGTKKATFEQADRDAQSKRAAFQEAARRQQRIDDIASRLAGMRDEYRQAKKRPAPADVEDLKARISTTQEDVVRLTREHQRAEEVSRHAEHAKGEIERVSSELAFLESQLATRRAAVVIFGKGGAQRRVAESALAVIQRGANDMLQDCGIGLSVGVSWSREGTTPAKTCDACGTPFPASAKVKKCIRCGADRGPLLVNKLDILLSEQSGAAEDLAGIAIQLSASAWLRSTRHAPWSMAMIDEPVSQLDGAHRKLLANHLAALLSSRYGFEQSFVTAHHSSVLDTLPGRIEVVSDGRYSTLRVAA